MQYGISHPPPTTHVWSSHASTSPTIRPHVLSPALERLPHSEEDGGRRTNREGYLYGTVAAKAGQLDYYFLSHCAHGEASKGQVMVAAKHVIWANESSCLPSGGAAPSAARLFPSAAC